MRKGIQAVRLEKVPRWVDEALPERGCDIRPVVEVFEGEWDKCGTTRRAT